MCVVGNVKIKHDLHYRRCKLVIEVSACSEKKEKKKKIIMIWLLLLMAFISVVLFSDQSTHWTGMAVLLLYRSLYLEE